MGSMMGGGGAMQALGGLFQLGGGALGGFSANSHRDEFLDLMRSLPRADVGTEQRNWFADLESFYPRAGRLSQRARNDELNQNLLMRERALPGFGAATADAMRSIAPLLRGELPSGVMDAFRRAGSANSVGLGFGGTGFGALNTGLFGARGALGAIETGMGLLPRLLGTMPQVSAPTTMGLLGQLMTPQQRIAHQMDLRNQQIGINSTYSSMPTMMDVWSQTLTQMGSQMMGASGGGEKGWSVPLGQRVIKTQDPWAAATGANMSGAMGQAAGRLY